MKKKLIILLLVLALLPLRTFAGSNEYKETDDQAVIYLFRGQGCTYCRAFLSFLNTISPEYGKYFKLVSFEVWNDEKNANLLDKVASVTKEEAGGVPYIIIGEKVFAGYSEAYDDQIKEAIMAQYKDPSYDIMKKANVNVSDYNTTNFVETLKSEDMELIDGGDTSGDNGGSSSFAIVFWNVFFVAVGVGVLIYFNNKNTERVLEAIKKEDKKETKKNNN